LSEALKKSSFNCVSSGGHLLVQRNAKQIPYAKSGLLFSSVKSSKEFPKRTANFQGTQKIHKIVNHQFVHNVRVLAKYCLWGNSHQND